MTAAIRYIYLGFNWAMAEEIFVITLLNKGLMNAIILTQSRREMTDRLAVYGEDLILLLMVGSFEFRAETRLALCIRQSHLLQSSSTIDPI